MIAIIDYKVGNLFSLARSLDSLSLDNAVTDDANKIRSADKIILPGVGAFADALRSLEATGLVPVILDEVKKGKPLLGICLGMQLLFDKSYEYGVHSGLSLINGEVCPIEADLIEKLKVPHMGWNSLIFKKKSRLFKYVNEGDYVYYVHSYYAKNCEKDTVATSRYGIELTGAVERDNLFGTQFHPEKSGDVGLKILKAFAEIEG